MSYGSISPRKQVSGLLLREARPLGKGGKLYSAAPQRSLKDTECLQALLAQKADMKSSVIPADTGYSVALDVQPSGGTDVVESFDAEPSLLLATEASPNLIPLHPLGVRPSGNQYTATSNARHRVGPFRILPDEILASFLDFLESRELRMLGSTCKFLHSFCRTEDLWKALFIE